MALPSTDIMPDSVSTVINQAANKKLTKINESRGWVADTNKYDLNINKWSTY